MTPLGATASGSVRRTLRATLARRAPLAPSRAALVRVLAWLCLAPWLAACAAAPFTPVVPADGSPAHDALARALSPPAESERLLVRLHAVSGGIDVDVTALVLLRHPDALRAAALDELGGTTLAFVLDGDAVDVTRAAPWLSATEGENLARDLARALLRPARAADWSPARTADGRPALGARIAGEDVLALTDAHGDAWLEFGREGVVHARVALLTAGPPGTSAESEPSRAEPGGLASIGYSRPVRVFDPAGDARAGVIVLERRAVTHGPDAFRPQREP